MGRRRPNPNVASTSKNVVDLDDLFDYQPDDINMADDYEFTFDPEIWSLIHDPPFNAPAGILEPGDPSYFPGETSGHGGTQENIDVPESSGINPVQVSVWPVPPSPYNCSCCQTLREIVHTNGQQFEKFEIHGRLGLFISHAVLSKYENAPSTNCEYQMFDFCAESITGVKKFLVQYCQDRRREGYQMLRDPLLLFYDALIVGLNFDNPHQPTSPMSSDCNVIEQETQPGQQTNEAGRSLLAIQRERTGKMEMKDLAKYFHLKIEDAAKRLHICPTVVKKICRRHRLYRWPHRKVKSIRKKLAEKRQEFQVTRDEVERARAQAEIQNLEQELSEIYSIALE